MAIKIIIFDFDGTIADSFALIVKITNRLSTEFGYQPVTNQELLELKNLTAREIIKKSQISIFKIPFLLRRVKTEFSKEVIRLKPIPGIDRALLDLKQKGYRLGIITSNDRKNVMIFLQKNNLDNLFDFVCADTTIFGKHKAIDNFLKQNQFNLDEVIYVGDETRDINAAKTSKIKSIGVSWGFNSAFILAKYKPDFLLEKPEEFIKAIETLIVNS